MNDNINNIKAGGDINAGDGGYNLSTQERYEEFKRSRMMNEPVAVVSGYYGGQCVILPTNPARLFNSGTALYTAPPIVATPLAAQQKPWAGLDSLEVSDLWLDTPFDDCTEETFEAGRAFVEAIEAKLKEKNT
jgi:hypothetical protein